MGFFLQDNADIYDIFKKFMTRAENEFELKVKKVRSDNGSEFRNTRVDKWCDEKGIKQPSTLRNKMVLLRGKIEP